MDSIYDLFLKHNERLASGLTILMIIFMSWSLATVIIFFLENMDDPINTQILSNTSTTDLGVSPAVDLSALNLFGNAEASAEVSQTTSAPKTRLNLQLKGVFRADKKEDSTAIVAEKNKEGILYLIGDRLPGDAILFEVYDDYILIKRGSTLEKLLFDDSAFRDENSFLDNTAKQAEFRQSFLPKSLADRPGTPISGAEQQKVLQARIEEYKNKFASNPQQVLNEFGLKAVEKSDKNGYQLDPNNAHPLFKQVGLQDGDVILSVNGTPLGAGADETSLVDQALKSKRLRVEIQRDSRRFFLTVPLP